MATEESQVKRILHLTSNNMQELRSILQVSDDVKSAFDLVMSSTEWEAGHDTREAAAYLGFDAIQIIKQFFKIVKDNPIQPGDSPTLRISGNLSLYEKCEPKSDLLFFINVFLERGNNVQKASSRCSDEFANILRRKCILYGINLDANKSKLPMGPKTLTLARIAQAFSTCTAAVILDKSVKGKLTSKVFPSVPALMTHTIFPGLIPSGTSATEDLRTIAMILNAEMSMMLATPKEKRKLAATSFEDILEGSAKFVDAAMNGSLVPDDIKVKIMVKAGILTVTTAGLVGKSTALRAMITILPNVKSHQQKRYLEMVASIRLPAPENE